MCLDYSDSHPYLRPQYGCRPSGYPLLTSSAMLLSAVSYASSALLASAGTGVVCRMPKGCKRAGLTLGLLMDKKSKKRNPT